MRSKRIPAEEQYRLIMECRQSGLTDHQWCVEHDIKPGTFYNWVKRLRQKGCVVSAKYCYAAHESRLHQNDRCKRFALCLVLTVRFRSLAPWGKLFQLFI